MRRFALILLIWPAILSAQQAQTLTGPGIFAALSGRTLQYEDGAKQEFEASMLTQYFSGRPSSGYWTVQDGRYCSRWPPSDIWACYDVQVKGNQILFVDDSGSVTSGVYVD